MRFPDRRAALILKLMVVYAALGAVIWVASFIWKAIR